MMDEASTKTTKRAYISYSQRSDFRLTKYLVKASKRVKENKWSIHYDANDLEASGSISRFMEKLSEGDKIIILLSPGYFQSSYCMDELLQIYQKRANELAPIVVFVGGLRSSKLKVEEVLTYWCSQLGSESGSKFYREIERKLPTILKWLLGPYDRKHDGQDIKFHVHKRGVRLDDVANGVILDLNKDNQARFASFSWDRRWQLIKNEVNKILGSERFVGEFSKLCNFSVENKNDEYVVSFGYSFEKLSGEGRFLGYCLKAVSEWLDVVKSEWVMSGKRMPKNVCAEFSNKVKLLIGWLLFSAVDGEKLHLLVHELNHLGDDADLQLLGECGVSVQLLVSTIAKSPVLYRYIGGKEPHLRGRGELPVTEQGVVVNNYKVYVQNEIDFLGFSRQLYKEVTGRTVRYKNEDTMKGAMEAALDEKKDIYVQFEQEFVSLGKSRELRTGLGQRYPWLQQVIKGGEQHEQDYFREGINVGNLDHMVLSIYEKLDKMT